MARLRFPVVALAFLLLIAAAMVGLFFVLLGSRHASAGAAWALIVFLAVAVTMVAVAVLRRNNTSRSEQP